MLGARAQLKYHGLSVISFLKLIKPNKGNKVTPAEVTPWLNTHLSQKFYGGGENGFKEGRDDTAAGISSIKPFFNQEVVIVSMSIVTAWHDLEKGSRHRSLARYQRSRGRRDRGSAAAAAAHIASSCCAVGSHTQLDSTTYYVCS